MRARQHSALRSHWEKTKHVGSVFIKKNGPIQPEEKVILDCQPFRAPAIRPDKNNKVKRRGATGENGASVEKEKKTQPRFIKGPREAEKYEVAEKVE